MISYGTSVSTCALADMDADGKLDLVTSSPSANVISIRRGNGDGTFSAFKSDFPTGARPWFFALGDLDGDGDLDAVTVNTNASTVSVLLGTGAGGFFPKTDYPTGAGAVYGAIADLDGDLIPDIAVACGGANRVDVLLGGGSGAFAPATSVSTGVSPVGIVLEDLDEDGHRDIAVTLGGDGAIAAPNGIEFHAGTGTGAFGPPTLWSTGNAPGVLTSGDWNGDSRLDLATSDRESQTHGMSIVLGHGDGTFGVVRRFRTGDGPTAVDVGDLNGDGRPDLVTANGGGESISVGLGNGDGTFGAREDFPAGPGPSGLALGDFDGNGALDVAVSNGDSADVSVRLGAGNGAFGPETRFRTGILPRMVATGDLNGDGSLDLVVPNASSSSITVLRGTGAGSFLPRLDARTPSHPSALALGDLNGDGLLDVVVIAQGDFFPTLSVLPGNGDGGFGPRTDYQTGSSLQSVGVADMDNDGRLDVVGGMPGAVLVYRGNGDGSLQPPVAYAVRGPAWSLALRDFDLDGRIDIACAQGVANWVGVLRGAALGVLEGPYYGSGRNVVAVRGADVDADGAPDLVAVDQATNEVTVMLNTLSAAGAPGTPPTAEGVAIEAFPNPADVSMSLRWTGSRSAIVKACVYDLAGRMVKRLFEGAVPAGSRTWIWDLRDESGRRVAPGVFIVEIRGYGSMVRRRIAVLR